MNSAIAIKGLTNAQAVLSAKTHGINSLTKIKKKGLLKRLIENLSDPMIRVLLIALSINVVFLFGRSNWYESLGIAIAVIIAVVVSTISEGVSEKAFLKLQEQSKNILCRVIRDGKPTILPITEIVVGDYVLLAVGDKIPADGVIINGNLEVDQSSLNGESKEASKYPTNNNQNDFLNPNLLFSSTVVNGGEALMRVESVGDNTFYGKLAKEIQEETIDSPLKTKLNSLAKKISLFGYIGAGLVGFSYLFNALIIKNSFNSALILKSFSDYQGLLLHILNSATFAVTVIVLAVPEGLPMMITVVLSANMRRMLKDNVLIRKLNGIETAGSLNILFTDKTGTLTNGKLDVVNLVFYDGKIIDKSLNNSKLSEIVSTSLMFNNSCQMINSKATGGNATDRVLTEYAYSLNNPQKNLTKIDCIPFDSNNKYMATTVKGLNQGNLTLIKGASEKILKGCKYCYNLNGEIVSLTNQAPLIKAISELSYKAMRIIAIATSKNPIIKNHQYPLEDLTLVGLVAIRDQIRPEAIEGVLQVSRAGIQTVMITGDSKATAMAVARETGILFSNSDLVLTSDELNKLTDDQLRTKLKDLRVVARALPTDKSRLIKIAQSLNLVAGMTGDGVNDAPALKKADIGFSMGSGTEVAKEAGDIVILDDNIMSIFKAISYGRTVFKSIRKFIVFQLTINFCAMTISIIAPLLNIEMPITVIQMLWINLVMDTLAGIAFGGERPRAKYMNELPKSRNEPIINKYMWQQIIFNAFYMAVICILFLKKGVNMPMYANKNKLYSMTAFFALFMFLAIFNSFNARTHEINLFDYLALNKPFIYIISLTAIVQILLIYIGGSVFRTTALEPLHLIAVLSIAFSIIPLDIFRKMITKKLGLLSGT